MLFFAYLIFRNVLPTAYEITDIMIVISLLYLRIAIKRKLLLRISLQVFPVLVG